LTAINANFDKVFGYLREFPRFSSRYLWAQKLAVDGDADLIWGVIDDIWHWHFNKISPNDPAATIHSAAVSDFGSASTKPRSSNLPKAVASLSRGRDTKMEDYLRFSYNNYD